MDIKKRLFRKPITTAVWFLLVTVMALLFVVGFALYWSSGNLAGVLSAHPTTVAVRTEQSTTGTAIEGGAKWEIEPHSLSQEDVDLLESLPGVEGVYFHTLTGGYSPDFTPVMGIKNTMWGATDAQYMVNESYDDVLAVVEVVDIYETSVYTTYDMTALGLSAEEPDQMIYAEARIIELLEGNPDYAAPQDDLINLYVSILGKAAESYLQEGQRYLIQGVYDPEKRCGGENVIGPSHPFIKSEGVAMLQGDQLWYIGGMTSAIDDFDTIVYIDTEDTSPCLAKLEGSAEDFLSDPKNRTWAEIAASYDTAQHSLPVMGTDCLESMYLFVTNEATVTQGRAFTQEEYDSGAKVCLLSESLAEKSGLQVGSSFTMSQFLVHDFKNNNYDITNASTASGHFNVDGKLNNPTVGYVGPDTEFVTEDEEFTVIGLYRLQDQWADESYSLTPNTVFIPKRAQIEGGFGGIEEMVQIVEHDGFTYERPNENGAHGVYLSVKLENGGMSQFLEALEATDLRGTFLAEDQGYGAIQESINAVAQNAWQVFRIALLGWVLILVLYVLLYQGLQRKNLGAMRSQGSGVKAARRYLFGSGFILAVSGVVLGAVLGAVLLDVIQHKVLLAPLSEAAMIQHSGGQALTPEDLTLMLQQNGLSVPQLLLMGLIQAGIIGLVLWIHAALLARQNPRKLLRL